MFHRALLVFGLFLAPALALALALAPAADTHDIKFRDAMQGDVAQIEDETTEVSKVKVTDPTDKILVDTEETKIKTFVYKESILEKAEGEKKSAKLERAYEKAHVKTGDKTEKLAYEGKTVVIEKKQDGYHFRFKGGEELTAKEAELLTKEFNKPDGPDPITLLLPDKGVKVDELWKIDPKKFVEELEKQTGGTIAINPDKAKLTGKLIKVYQNDGGKWGQVHFELNLPIKELGVAGKKAPALEGSQMTLKIQVDGCIDGSVDAGTADGDVKMDVTALVPSAGGGENKVHVVVTTKGRKTQKSLAKK